MKRTILFSIVIACLAFLGSCKKTPEGFRIITPEVLKDKIAGGWAGKMIGVTYGAPTEYLKQRLRKMNPLNFLSRNNFF